MGNALGYRSGNNTGIHAGRDVNAEFLQSIVGHGNTITQNLPPRAPPPVRSFRVVSRPSLYFMGRADVMAKIDRILTGAGGFRDKLSWDKRILVVHGIPGIGKSELMRQFAQNYEDKYRNIAWINAESHETIGKGFKALADILTVDWDKDSELKDNITKVYKHVENFCGSSSLIIFDNVTDLVQIHDSLPVSQSIKAPPIIVMTTNVPSDGAYKNLQLGKLDLEEAVEVFQAFLKPSEGQFSEVVNQLLKELANLVDCHALAMVISASYLLQKSTRFLEEELRVYIESVRDLSAVFAKAEPRVQGATPYLHTLRALWKLTMDRVKKNTDPDAALYLLRVLGYIDPENIEEIELKQLCLWDCPLVQNDDFSEFFKNRGARAVCDGICQLQKLSVLTAISEAHLDNPRYRIHRLLQRFAREEDGEQVGIRRVFYHSVDYVPPFIYPGCLEYLQAMIRKGITVDEKLKQICIVVAITAKDAIPDDTLAQLIRHFETVGGNGEETKVLLRMAQLHNSTSDQPRGDGSCTIDTMSEVLSLATNWTQPGYGTYLIQNCASKIILHALYTSPKCLDGAIWQEDFTRNFKLWLEIQIQLHEEQAGRSRGYFPKIVDPCMPRVYRALKEVLQSNENMDSLEGFVNCLVRQVFQKCRSDDELEDGYWHVLSGCLRMECCKKVLQEVMELIINHVKDSFESCNAKNVGCHDGLLDCLFMLALVPEWVSQFCSNDHFMQELSKQAKLRVGKGFGWKDIYFGIFILMAFIQDSQKTETIFSSWNFSELLQLMSYIQSLSNEAALMYRRWAKELDEILDGFLGGRNLLQTLEEVAAREPGNSVVQQQITMQVQNFLRIFRNGPQ